MMSDDDSLSISQSSSEESVIEDTKATAAPPLSSYRHNGGELSADCSSENIASSSPLTENDDAILDDGDIAAAAENVTKMSFVGRTI